jgi:hypothetical protein
MTKPPIIEHRPKPTIDKVIGTIGALVVLAGCSLGDGKERASASCDAVEIAAKLSGIDKLRHKNACMRGKGYIRNTLCDTLPADMSSRALCFSSAWNFWVKRAVLFE